jgi:hypothetical protein
MLEDVEIIEDVDIIEDVEVFVGGFGRYGSGHPEHAVSLQQKLSSPVVPQQSNTQGDNRSAILPLPLQFHNVSWPQSVPK